MDRCANCKLNDYCEDQIDDVTTCTRYVPKEKGWVKRGLGQASRDVDSWPPYLRGPAIIRANKPPVECEQCVFVAETPDFLEDEVECDRCGKRWLLVPAAQWADVVALPKKWIAEQAEYPTAEVHAAAAVRLCARELRKALSMKGANKTDVPPKPPCTSFPIRPSGIRVGKRGL